MFTFNPNLASGEDNLDEGDESFDVRNLGKDLDDNNEEEMQIEVSSPVILGSWVKVNCCARI